MDMTEKQNGILTQVIGGFYYVEAADTVYTCKARGAFRKQGISPMVGDHVRICVQPDGIGTVEEILPRRNALMRPPVANLDCLVIVIAVAEPSPNMQIIDTMIAIAEQHGIEPVLVINKTDISDGGALLDIYRKTGLVCFVVSARQPETLTELFQYLSGKVSGFTGNSGVGKSSILNALEPSLDLKTGEISKKLGRGRHTTRVATLLHVGDCFIVDTPGFSSLDIGMVAENLDREQLFFCFREFEPFFNACRFSSCTHVNEPGCAVKQAVADGKIAPTRYESYVALYEQLKNKKDWE